MLEKKIKELGYELPEPAKPLAAYIPAKKVDNFVFTAGQIPLQKGELKYKGKVGNNISEETGKKAAEICCLNCLAAIKGVIGDLNKIDEIVKLTVFVNSIEGFSKEPSVANGASELLVKIFGEKGKHARSAVGVNSLPMDAQVEVEMVVKIKVD